MARFCSHHLAQELWQLDSFKQGNVGESLIQVRARGIPEAVAIQLSVPCQAGAWLHSGFACRSTLQPLPCAESSNLHSHSGDDQCLDLHASCLRQRASVLCLWLKSAIQQ